MSCLGCCIKKKTIIIVSLSHIKAGMARQTHKWKSQSHHLPVYASRHELSVSERQSDRLVLKRSGNPAKVTQENSRSSRSRKNERVPKQREKKRKKCSKGSCQNDGRLDAGRSRKKKKEDENDTRTIKMNNGRIILQSGDSVNSQQHKYTVVDILGSGGFGDVYKVRQEHTDKLFALKTERQEGEEEDDEERKNMRLKMECKILQECEAIKEFDRKKHFVKMLDKGQMATFKFVVMGLVGPQLTELREKYLESDFSASTALQVSLQTLKAVYDLHNLGYIHRDLKPQNFAIGLGDKQGIVFMLDFGIARRFLADKDDLIKPKRMAVASFVGTLRFASRNGHLSKEQGRRDDLEAWVYMTIDLFDMDLLPWKGVCDGDKVVERKEAFFRGEYKSVYKVLPKNFRQITDYVDDLDYVHIPDYKKIRRFVTRMAKGGNIDLNARLDWVKKGRRKRGERRLRDYSEDDSDISEDS